MIRHRQIREQVVCDLPDGWIMKMASPNVDSNGYIRTNVYYLAPDKTLIRSMVGLKRYFGGSVDLTGFNFHTGRFEASQVSRKIKTKLTQPRSTETHNHLQPAATSGVNYATPNSSKRGRPRKTSVVPNTTSTPSLSMIPNKRPKKMRVSDKLYPIYFAIQKGKVPFILAGKRPQLPSSSTDIEEVGMSAPYGSHEDDEDGKSDVMSSSSSPAAAESSIERITPPEDIQMTSLRFKPLVSPTSTRPHNEMKLRVRKAPLSDYRGLCSLPNGWLMERRVRKDGPLVGKVEDVSYISPDNRTIHSFVELKTHFRVDLSGFNYESGKFDWEEDGESSRADDHLPNIQAESGENPADRKCNTGVELGKAPQTSYKRGRGRPRKTSVVHTAGSRLKFVVESTPSSKSSLMEDSKVEKNPSADPISIKCASCELPGDWVMVERTRMIGDLTPQTCVSYTLDEGETQSTFRSKQTLQQHFHGELDLTEFNFETGRWTEISAVANRAERVKSTTSVDESTSSSLTSTRGERLEICDVVEKTTIDDPNAREDEDPILLFLRQTTRMTYGDGAQLPTDTHRPDKEVSEVEEVIPDIRSDTDTDAGNSPQIIASFSSTESGGERHVSSPPDSKRVDNDMETTTTKDDMCGNPCKVERSRQLSSTSYSEMEDNSPLEQIGEELNRETQMEVPAEHLGTSSTSSKHTGWSACPRGLPPGWLWRKRTRPSGRFKGKVDVYYLSPKGKWFRSLISLKKHFYQIGLDLRKFDYKTATFKGNAQQSGLLVDYHIVSSIDNTVEEEELLTDKEIEDDVFFNAWR